MKTSQANADLFKLANKLRSRASENNDVIESPYGNKLGITYTMMDKLEAALDVCVEFGDLDAEDVRQWMDWARENPSDQYPTLKAKVKHHLQQARAKANDLAEAYNSLI